MLEKDLGQSLYPHLSHYAQAMEPQEGFFYLRRLFAAPSSHPQCRNE